MLRIVPVSLFLAWLRCAGFAAAKPMPSPQDAVYVSPQGPLIDITVTGTDGIGRDFAHLQLDEPFAFKGGVKAYQIDQRGNATCDYLDEHGFIVKKLTTDDVWWLLGLPEHYPTIHSGSCADPVPGTEAGTHSPWP